MVLISFYVESMWGSHDSRELNIKLNHVDQCGFGLFLPVLWGSHDSREFNIKLNHVDQCGFGLFLPVLWGSHDSRELNSKFNHVDQCGFDLFLPVLWGSHDSREFNIKLNHVDQGCFFPLKVAWSFSWGKRWDPLQLQKNCWLFETCGLTKTTLTSALEDGKVKTLKEHLKRGWWERPKLRIPPSARDGPWTPTRPITSALCTEQKQSPREVHGTPHQLRTSPWPLLEFQVLKTKNENKSKLRWEQRWELDWFSRQLDASYGGINVENWIDPLDQRWELDWSTRSTLRTGLIH